MRYKRASLEDITGKTWVMAVTIVIVLIALGPTVVHFVQSALNGSMNTVSSNISFQNMIS